MAMVGGTAAHDTINMNLIAALATRLRGKLCRVHGPSMMVSVNDDRYRYPDATVTRTPLAPEDRIITTPVVIFEILSPSTEHTDKTVKLPEYLALPTLQRYVMIEQDQALVTVLARTVKGWSFDLLRPGQTLAMPEITADIPIDDLYETLTFPPPPLPGEATPPA